MCDALLGKTASRNSRIDQTPHGPIDWGPMAIHDVAGRWWVRNWQDFVLGFAISFTADPTRPDVSVAAMNQRLSLVLVAVLLTVACGQASEIRVTAAADFVAPSSVPAAATWAPWPTALHDSRHSGASTFPGPVHGTVKWRRQLEGGVTPGPIVAADGTIYVSSNGGVLHALDPKTGHDKWAYDAHHAEFGDLSTSPLALPDGNILWPIGDHLLALSPTGRLLWSLPLTGNATSPTSVDGHRVYVGDSSGAVTAVDITATDRAVAWSIRAGGISYGSVVTAGGGRLYTTADSALVAIDDHGASGTVVWKVDPGDGISEVSAGLAPNGTALLGTNGSKEWAYHADGTPAWHTDRAITYASPAVTATGLAYIGDHRGNVFVYDTATGSTEASYQVGAEIWSAPLIDRDYHLYVAGHDGHLHGFAADGSQLFELDLGAPVNSYPALTADGTLLVGSANGALTAVE